MQIIQYFTTKGINVTAQKQAFTKIADHKENPIAKLMIGILVALAEFELSRIKERQAKERANAKKKFTYAVLQIEGFESIEPFLAKKSNQKTLWFLKQKESIYRNCIIFSSS